jgi:hypothetical protein
MSAEVPPRDRRTPYRVVALAWLAVILVATLMPRGGATHPENLTPVLCLVCGEAGAVDVLYNLALFIPLGFALRLGGLKSGRIILLSFCLTFAVESAQYWIIPGRDASLSDVLTNTAGGAAGVLLANILPILLDPVGPALAILLGLSTLLPAGTLAVSAWLLRSAPPRSLWYGQWAPELGQYDQFQGRIVTAELGGRFMPGGPLRGFPTREKGGPEIPLVLGATFVTGAPPTELAPIVSIFDEHQQKVLLLGQRGNRLEFEPRIRGEDYRFRPLRLSLAGVIPADIGDTLRAEGGFDDRVLRLAIRGPGVEGSRSLKISPALGWVLIAPLPWPLGREARAVNALWLVLLWAPLGFYLARAVRGSGRASRPVIVCVAAAGAALLIAGLTHAAGLPRNHWSELAAATIPILLGFGATSPRVHP